MEIVVEMCEKCSTLHLSNFSIGVQYGDEIAPTACTCECHLDEDNFHGKASREWRDAQLLSNRDVEK